MSDQRMSKTNRADVLSIPPLRGLNKYEIHAFISSKVDDVYSYMKLFVGSLPAGAVGFIPQEPMLFDQFTVVENLYLCQLPFYRFNRRAVYKRNCQALFNQLEIDIDTNRLYRSLTSEEKKLVDLMWAIVNDRPGIIMYDTFTLIKKHPSVFQKILNYAKSRGILLLYFSSKWEDASRIADQIHIISNNDETAVFSSMEVKRDPHDLISSLYDLPEVASANDLRPDDTLLEEYGDLFLGAEHFTSSFEMNDTLRRLTQAIAASFSADSCVLYINNEQSPQNRYYPYYVGDSVPLLKRNVLDGLLFRHADNIQFPVVYDRMSLPAVTESSPVNVSSVYCMPIVLNGVSLGLVQLVYGAKNNSIEPNAILLKRFCKEVSLMIEMARLMNRSLLLNESHHRIKNNLQLVVSLLTVQKQFMTQRTNVDASKILNSTIERIRTIAVIHDILTNSNNKSNTISLREILEKLFELYRNYPEVVIDIQVQNVYISQKKATSLALVLNELICNAFKYAFAGKHTDKKIRVEAYPGTGKYIIVLSDNGIGFDGKTFNDGNASFGLSIVDMIITREFKGTIDFSSDNGTRIVLSIPSETLNEISIL